MAYPRRSTPGTTCFGQSSYRLGATMFALCTGPGAFFWANYFALWHFSPLRWLWLSQSHAGELVKSIERVSAGCKCDSVFLARDARKKRTNDDCDMECGDLSPLSS